MAASVIFIDYLCGPIRDQAHSIARAVAFEEIKRFIRSRARFDTFDGHGVLAREPLASDFGSDDL